MTLPIQDVFDDAGSMIRQQIRAVYNFICVQRALWFFEFYIISLNLGLHYTFINTCNSIFNRSIPSLSYNIYICNSDLVCNKIGVLLMECA